MYFMVLYFVKFTHSIRFGVNSSAVEDKPKEIKNVYYFNQTAS